MVKNKMKTFNFSANWVDFGDYQAETLDQAKDNFASDAGYKDWQDMVNRIDEDGYAIRIELVITKNQTNG